jgi:hypothetical protein
LFPLLCAAGLNSLWLLKLIGQKGTGIIPVCFMPVIWSNLAFNGESGMDSKRP